MAKWKNQRKWSMTTRMHDATKDREVRLMKGQRAEKFCRYTKWQKMEKIVWGKGRESVKYNKTCSVIMT